MKWHKPVPGHLPDAPGTFGFQRKFHIHEGVDIYCKAGTYVRAVEDGIIVDVCDFTGHRVGSPWWNDTMAVAVEGNSGVVIYGEIGPIGAIVGKEVKRGMILGYVIQVLKKDKGRPMSMLHLELHEHGYYESVPWDVGAEKPVGLLDPTPYLKDIYEGA